MFYHLAKIATRYCWLIVGLWVVAVIIALPFAPQASQVLHSGGFTSPNAESEQAINVLVQKLHLQPTVVQVIFTSHRYSVEDPPFLQQTQHALAKLHGWSEVAQIVTFVDNPRQVSLDRHAAYVNVELKSDPDAAPKLLPEFQRRLQRVPDLQSSIGGGAVFYEDIQAVSERDLRRAEILAFPFAIIALLFVFRSVIAAVLPALIGGCSVVISLALIFGLGQITTLSIFVLNITTLFGLGLGVDYSLFMVSRFREELEHGCDVTDAVTVTVATAGRAVAFSGLAVSIGLLGLTFIRINMLHSVGLGGIVVVILAVLAALTLLPAMLTILGRKVNALPVRFPRLWKHADSKTVQDEAVASEVAVQSGFWYRLSHFVMRYPVRVFVLVLCLLIGFGLPFLWVRFSAPDASILPAGVPSRQAYDLLAKRFSNSETTPILLAVQTKGNVLTETNIENLYFYVKRIEADPRVKRVDSIVSVDPRFMLDQYEVLYTHPQLITDPYISALLQSTVSGNTIMVRVISKYEVGDLRSQTLVQTIRNTSAGHGLLFRSLVLPLKAIIMNTLSILASYGALVVIFQQGFLHQLLGFSPLGFVEASSPILLFCSLFGLSMDYEVFLLSRIQEAFWQTGDNTQSVALGLQRSGAIITSAAIIVIVVSACFATADMILVKALGLGMALAVLIDATLVRGLLVPATMRLLGKWNWWLPFVGVQRHPPSLAEYIGASDSSKAYSGKTTTSVGKNVSMEGKR